MSVQSATRIQRSAISSAGRWQKGLWKLGFHRALPDRPSTLMVEPTNVCNLHCPACPTGAGILNRPPRAMSFEEFRHILDQALDPPGYLRRVTLFNYGEPFLCKDLLRMVRCAADRGLETFTSTNGQFFGGEKIAGEVVASGLTELLVCLDGADQETISRYRKDANFDEILAGIRRILAARARRRSSGQAAPIVELQFIVMKHNESQVERMRRIAADLGVDRFIVKTVGISPGMPGFERLAEELLPADLAGSRYERRADGVVRAQGRTGLRLRVRLQHAGRQLERRRRPVLLRHPLRARHGQPLPAAAGGNLAGREVPRLPPPSQRAPGRRADLPPLSRRPRADPGDGVCYARLPPRHRDTKNGRSSK